MKLFKLLLLVAISFVGVHADESKIPEPFRGETSNAPIEINYSDWSKILKGTVLKSAPSSRQKAVSVSSTDIGTRVGRGNKKDTRNEGNRILFKVLAEKENLEILEMIRKGLELVPGEVPMKHWDKNEQLAYWLNLYNVTIIAELAKEYPFRSLKKMKKAKNNIWSRKTLNVAGVPLSLDDIQHTILLNKWDTTLVMYGLYQGYISGPNVQNDAYTGRNVRRMLIANAKDYVNSNRGMKVKGKTLNVSAFYKENEVLFPEWKSDLKTHIVNLTKPNMQNLVRNTSKIKTLKPDYYTTDLHGGGKLPGSGTATSRAGLMFADFRVDQAAPGAAGASANSGFKYSDINPNPKVQSILDFRLPASTLEYIKQMRKNGLMREGDIRIEEVDGGKTNNSNESEEGQ